MNTVKTIAEYPEVNGYGIAILSMAHKEFMGFDLHVHNAKGCIVYDVK